MENISRFQKKSELYLKYYNVSVNACLGKNCMKLKHNAEHVINLGFVCETLSHRMDFLWKLNAHIMGKHKYLYKSFFS